MIGLFGALGMAKQSLATQRQGVEVAGHNLANVNNPAYARQRALISATAPVTTEIGQQGTGSEVLRITQLRNSILDHQIQDETSVRSSLEAQQTALDLTQAALGQSIDRQATGPEGTAAATGTGGQRGIAEDLSDFFAAFQSLSTNPTSSAERQVLLMKSQNLAAQFNSVSNRLGALSSSLDDSLTGDVTQANQAIADIARLNDQISSVEVGGRVTANDLRDTRQQRVEALAKLINIDVHETPTGALDISSGSNELVSASSVAGKLEVFDAGSGQKLVRLAGSADAMSLGGGSIQGTLSARDGELATLRGQVHTLASTLIKEVNQIHQAGFDLNGNTGEKFFLGSDASDIRVNSVLLKDPSRVQAAGVSGAVGDNSVVLSLAQLGDKRVAAVGNQTLSERYGQTVSELGQSLSSVNTQLDNQNVVDRMLLAQRDSYGGVSLDEEMMDLMRFQKAFDASAKLVVTISDMLDTVVNLKR